MNGGLKGALVSIDAVATRPSIAAAITAAGADYLLAVMAVVRHFALNLVRAVSDKRSIKLRPKRAGWDPS